MLRQRRSPMQASVERILEAHGRLEQFDGSYEFHLRLEKDGYQPLMIERHGNYVSVAHYFEQNGDLIADPDIVFDYATWTPTEIQQQAYYRRKFHERDGKTFVDVTFHKDVMALVNVWAKNLKWQGWEKAKAV